MSDFLSSQSERESAYPTIMTTKADSLVAFDQMLPRIPTTKAPKADTVAGELGKARPEKKFAENPAPPITTIARVSRRKSGCPFYSHARVSRRT